MLPLLIEHKYDKIFRDMERQAVFCTRTKGKRKEMFYLRLYGIGHNVVKDPPSHRQDAHTTSFDVEHWLKREIAYGPSWWIDPTTNRITSGRSTTELHIAPLNSKT